MAFWQPTRGLIGNQHFARNLKNQGEDKNSNHALGFFASSALRFAAGALFRATTNLSEGIGVSDVILDAVNHTANNLKAVEYKGEETATKPVDFHVSADEDKLPVISLSEVEQHYMENDAWMVIYDKVYDVTDFMNKHPGSMEVLLENVGTDATFAFESVGHSMDSMSILEQFLVGILPENERLYNKEGGYSQSW